MSTTHRCPHCGAAVPGKAQFCQECGGETTGSRKRFSTRTIGVLLMALVVLAGATFAGLQMAGPKSPATDTAQGHPTQIMGAGQMPVWLLSADRQIQNDYVWASSHLEELQYIPCYCGCGSFGHTDNYSCYFKRDQQAAITGYDNHAVG